LASILQEKERESAQEKKKERFKEDARLVAQQEREKAREKKKPRSYSRCQLIFICCVISSVICVGVVGLYHYFYVKPTDIHLGIRLDGLEKSFDKFYQEWKVLEPLRKKWAYDVPKLQQAYDILDDWRKEVGAAATRLTPDVSAKLLELIKELDERHFLDELTGARNLVGCFVGNTMIQINQYGDTLPIWLITPGTMIWNPVLEVQMKVARVIAGPETTSIWIISTKNNRTIEVTQSHPMYLWNPANQTSQIVPASELTNGVWTLTKGGPQLIMKVEKRIIIGSEKVFNIEIESTPATNSMNHRAIVANDIYTLDLLVQEMLESRH